MSGPSNNGDKCHDCLTDDQINDLLQDQINPELRLELEERLGSCRECQIRLEMAAGGSGWIQQARNEVQSNTNSQNKPFRSFSKDKKRQLEKLTFLTPSENENDLGMFGRYRVEQLIDRGATGIVLLCQDPDLERPVAIKVIDPAIASEDSFRQRFLREAKAAASIKHNSVVTIHHVGEHNDLPFIVMEYIDGYSLERLLEFSGPQPQYKILQMGLSVARGLAEAHKKGVIHRDIKPANLLIERPSDTIKIADFGLARALGESRITHTNHVAGTPHYMSPEQAIDEELTPQSDLFSFGSVLYSMATGHPPFNASSSLAIMKKVCEEDPVPPNAINPDISAPLVAFITRLMAKDKDSRFASAEEVCDVIRELINSGNAAQIATTQKKPDSAKKKHASQLTYLAIAIGVGLLIGLFLKPIISPQIPEEEQATLNPNEGFSGLPIWAARPPDPISNPKTTFKLLSSGKEFADIQTALLEAKDFETIICQFDGEYKTKPLKIEGGKNIRLQSGLKNKPIISLLGESGISQNSLIQTDGVLVLEGLDFRAENATNLKETQLVDCKGPGFFALNCGFYGLTPNKNSNNGFQTNPKETFLTSFSPDGPSRQSKVQFINCEWKSFRSQGFRWDTRFANRSQTLTFENCRMMNHINLSALVGPGLTNSVKSLNSHFLGEVFMDLQFMNAGNSGIQVHLDANILEGNHIIQTQPVKRNDTVSITTFRPTMFKWTGQGNAFLCLEHPFVSFTSSTSRDEARYLNREFWLSQNQAMMAKQMYPIAYTGQLLDRHQFWANTIENVHELSGLPFDYSQLEFSKLASQLDKDSMDVATHIEIIRNLPLNRTTTVIIGPQFYTKYRESNFYQSWLKEIPASFSL